MNKDTASYFVKLLECGPDVVERVEFRLQNTGITGKKGEREVHFSLESIAVIGGKEFVVTTTPCSCEEGYSLTVCSDVPYVPLKIDGNMLGSVRRLIRKFCV